MTKVINVAPSEYREVQIGRRNVSTWNFHAFLYFIVFTLFVVKEAIERETLDIARQLTLAVS